MHVLRNILLATALPIVTPTLAFMYWQRSAITNRLRRIYRFSRYFVGGRMDAKRAADVNRMMADGFTEVLDNLFLKGAMTGAERFDAFRRLSYVPGLTKEFLPRNRANELKEEIIKRRGTTVKTMRSIKPMPFPDLGQVYPFAYGPRAKSNNVLTMRSWKVKHAA